MNTKRKYFGGLLLVAAGLVGAMEAQGQLTPANRTLAVTNTAYTNNGAWTAAAGTVNLANGTNKPVFITQGKQMGLWANAVAPDATATNVTVTVEFSPDGTNYLSAPTANLVFALNGTTPVKAGTNWSTVITDNFLKARIKSVSSGSLTSYYFTNLDFMTH